MALRIFFSVKIRYYLRIKKICTINNAGSAACGATANEAPAKLRASAGRRLRPARLRGSRHFLQIRRKTSGPPLRPALADCTQTISCARHRRRFTTSAVRRRPTRRTALAEARALLPPAPNRTYPGKGSLGAARASLVFLKTKKDSLSDCPFDLRAENETRTRDPNLGKVVLYQLSYFRNCHP